MKNFTFILLFAFILQVTAQNSHDAAISVLNIPTDLCDATITPTLRITNAGSTALTSATITHQLDTDTPVVINWTGNLAMDAFEEIPLTAIAVSGAGAHSFTASVANPNGNVDESPSNDVNTWNFNIPDSFEVTTIRVIITPDRYGSETTWQLLDSTEALIADGGPYQITGTNAAQPDEITDVPITLLDECYTFIIRDEYADGICCAYGDGDYRLEDIEGNILIDGNGDFGADASHLFKVSSDVLSVSENALASNLRIYPNPSASDFTLNINNYTNLSYKVYTFAGQLIKDGSFSNGINTLSMKNEASGLYFITIRDNESNTSITRKLMKQ